MDLAPDRRRLIETKLPQMGVTDPLVVRAIQAVPREEFLPHAMKSRAYLDAPLAIGEDQTISQPSLVAFMTQSLELTPQCRVLEIGTGSGYQTAVLAELVARVYTIEVRDNLARSARHRLHRLRYDNIRFKIEDGKMGWSEHAPYDAILVTAAASSVPQALMDQLALGGRMVIPLNSNSHQELYRLTKTETQITREPLGPVTFVPLI